MRDAERSPEGEHDGLKGRRCRSNGQWKWIFPDLLDEGLMPISIKSILVVVALALAVPVPAGAASGPVTDLRTGVLRTSEVPAGLSAGHIKRFGRFSTTLAISVSGSPHSSTSSCEQPRSFTRDGWIQGLIAVYGVHLLPFLEICSALFRETRGAHAAYRALARLERVRSAGRPVRRLPVPPVGAEFQALGLTQNKLAAYDLVFRHGNAVINLVFLGESTVSARRFEHLASLIDARLR